MLIDYLKETYGEGKPIFVSQIEYNGMNRNAIRQQVMRMCKSGKLKRYDKGVYFFPRQIKSIFNLSPTLSEVEVIEQKYMLEGQSRIGYFTGFLVANQLGLTTQVPMRLTVVSNKATTDYRLVGTGSKLILLKPKVSVNDQNFVLLSILDLVKDIDTYAEVGYPETKQILTNYMDRCGISVKDLLSFLTFYPARTYRNLFKLGLLDDFSA